MVSPVTESQVTADVSAPNPEKLERIRHTCAHVLAMAVQTLFPGTKVTIGPTTDNGFYYDFDRAEPFTPDDLKTLETQMRRIIKAKLPVVREVVSRERSQPKSLSLTKITKLKSSQVSQKVKRSPATRSVTSRCLALVASN